jgi:exonuclease SbcC
MRPLKLTMKNFGPYQGTHTIDFQPLGQNGLYLITGPTGSGKSTIFDAICFALYGSPSRNIRRPKTLRNSYAKDDESMEVELEFVHGKKTYCAKRVYRINKKGEFAPTSNSLKEFDASKDKFSTTTCKIQDILGIEL